MTVSNIDFQEMTESVAGGKVLGSRFDLVKNVKVTLSVYLGNSEISVSDLFELKNGSLLTLDKDVNAPVDIKHDGNVIARGELVAIDDNFGVRITEIEK